MHKVGLIYLENQRLKELAEEVVEKVSKLFSKWSIVGSIMRGHEDYHDLDFLILDNEQSRIKKISGAEIMYESSDRVTVKYKDSLQVDFFLSTEEAWEAGRLAWGYGKANLRLRALAKEKGYKLNQDGLEKDGKVYTKIEDIERILDVELPEYLKIDKHSIDILRFFDPNSTVNEGRHRLLNPDGIEKNTYRRWNHIKNVPYRRGVSYIVGKCKSNNKMVVQAIRFDKSELTEEEAAEWFYANKKAIMKNALCSGYEWTSEDWKLHAKKHEQEVEDS